MGNDDHEPNFVNSSTGVSLVGLDGVTYVPSVEINHRGTVNNIGDVIESRYKVIREVGRGGMGVVFEVEDLVIGGRFALKRLLPHCAVEPSVVEQFKSEGISSLGFSATDSRFVTTHHVGMEGDQPFIVMELVQQPTLREFLRNRGPGFSLEHAYAILLSLAEALSSLHSLGFVHRDLKPENIFVDTSSGSFAIKLVDFGLSKRVSAITATAMKDSGTERYCSPEQRRGLGTTTATDVYSFGVIAYEILTGELPTGGDRITDYVPNVSKAMEQIIVDCLRGQPSVRLSDGSAVVARLKSLDRQQLFIPKNQFVDSKENITYQNPNRRMFIGAAVTSTVVGAYAYWIYLAPNYYKTKNYIGSLRPIPAGTFQMGGTKSDSEEPVHRVTLSAFRMGATPVTVAVWKEYCAATGTKLPAAPGWELLDDHPVVNVSWNDIMGEDGKGGFCAWASEIAGFRLTLPTEAQFEYSSRGGQSGLEYPWGNAFDDSKLWCSKSTKRTSTAPVTRSSNIFRNAYGLTDMSGNVRQWCSDLYGPYSSSSQNDPTGPSSTSDKVRCSRGGSWGSSRLDLFRCAFRVRASPDFWSDGNGFRLSAGPG